MLLLVGRWVRKADGRTVDVDVHFLADGRGHRNAMEGVHATVITILGGRLSSIVRPRAFGRGGVVVVPGAFLARTGVLELTAFQVVYDLGGTRLELGPAWECPDCWCLRTNCETQQIFDDGLEFWEKIAVEVLPNVIWEEWPKGIEVQCHKGARACA